VTLASYRRILNGIWRRKLDQELVHRVRFTMLVKIADSHEWSKKTYNNNVSVLRAAFNFGFRDHPELKNPAAGLKSVHICKKDRPVIDPFGIEEAEKR
jgi:integrase